jgi:hypothetical protein
MEMSIGCRKIDYFPLATVAGSSMASISHHTMFRSKRAKRTVVAPVRLLGRTRGLDLATEKGLQEVREADRLAVVLRDPLPKTAARALAGVSEDAGYHLPRGAAQRHAEPTQMLLAADEVPEFIHLQDLVGFELDVVPAYRELTNGWSEQRLRGRAQLRVRLYRVFSI